MDSPPPFRLKDDGCLELLVHVVHPPETFSLLKIEETHVVHQRRCLPVIILMMLFLACCELPFILVHGFSCSITPSRPSRFHATLSRPPTTSFCATNDDTQARNTLLEQVLMDNGYARRLVTISSAQLPVIAEVFSHGQCELCRIVSLEPAAKPGTPPLVQTQSISDKDEPFKIVDLGQITTIWESIDPDVIKDTWQQTVDEEIQQFPVNHCDHSMQRLYNSHVGRARSSDAGLTKKQITRIVEDASDQSHTEDVLRKVIKAGAGMMRLVDSSVAMDYLYEDYPKNYVERARRQMVGARVLTNDAQLGGRFKRMPCIYVSSELNEGIVKSISLVNGGWLIVDQSVRAGTEARKFADRTDHLLTVADERIAHRLECLAMGEVFSWDSKESRDRMEESGVDADLELDVKEALKAMDLPVSPAGAQQALVRLGRWTEGSNNRIKVEPWSEAVLEASRSYKRMDQQRRRQLLQALPPNTKGQSPKLLDGRFDLTGLPCVCVDARRTSFPDDAIGVRPRSTTGRKVVEEASKWEILVHITDVSDIYSPRIPLDDMKRDLALLQDAASCRGTSRYDLPLGPLHLMPPTVLEALSLQVNKYDETSTSNQENIRKKAVNRCVTLWAYIDENNGRLMDAGLERTLVSAPISLSFAGATSLLNGDLDSPDLKQAKAVLAVAERNLSLWSEQRRTRSEAARKREHRLSARELVAREQSDREQRDDGRSGFQRTRGHRTVDAALDLYGHAVTGLLRRARAPIPRSSGSGASRGGRVATAPLRRYIDGVAQRQALSVICGYGGSPLSKEECMAVSTRATEARNTLSNVRSTKKKGIMDKDKQRDALRLLRTHLASDNRPVPAISTGRENEVVIAGVGATARCQGVKGTLRPGDRVMVQVNRLDPERGSLSVTLVENQGR